MDKTWRFGESKIQEVLPFGTNDPDSHLYMEML